MSCRLCGVDYSDNSKEGCEGYGRRKCPAPVHLRDEPADHSPDNSVGHGLQEVHDSTAGISVESVKSDPDSQKCVWKVRNEFGPRVSTEH